jgi:putative sterol carrier protein
VPKFLSQEWLETSKAMAVGQPERPGASARLQYVVTGSPAGEVSYYWILENGRLSDARIGVLPDAEVTLTETYDDAVLVNKGELDATAAFMQGRVKVAGNMAKVMALLPLTNSPEYRAWQDEINKVTDF